MKVKFSAILSIEAALKAVEEDCYALQYVIINDLFVSIAAKLGIEVEP